MKLTGRQQDFLNKFLDLYREADHPLHYAVLADRVGVTKITAYEMLRLLEERGLAVVPVPQWLPEILADRAATPGSPNDAAPSLLVLGDVDYDAVPSAPKGAGTRGANDDPASGKNARRREAMHFTPLESSAKTTNSSF